MCHCLDNQLPQALTRLERSKTHQLNRLNGHHESLPKITQSRMLVQLVGRAVLDSDIRPFRDWMEMFEHRSQPLRSKSEFTPTE